MKRKLLLVLLTVAMAIACAFGFAGCKPTHTHTMTHHSATAATCTENGNVEYWSCSDCGKYFTDAEGKGEVTDITIEAKGHTWGAWEITKQATCKETGSQTRVCTVCIAAETQEISLAEHSWGEWQITEKATCTENGEETRTCEVCGREETKSLSALGHKYSAVYAYDENYHWQYSTVCGEKFNTAKHTYSDGACTVCDNAEVTSGLSYQLTPDSQSYSVIGIGEATTTKIIIPSTHNDLPVTSIGDYAFSGCDSIISITIPDSVTSIGEDAFYNCSGLTSITIPDSVTSIGENAFYGCSSLTSITLPFVGDSATASSASSSTLFGYIFGTRSYTSGTATRQYYTPSSYATYYIPASLKSVTITGGNIFYGAFYNCSGLTSITIPNSVTSIGSSAFYDCSGLTSITISDSVTSIGEWAFYNCTGLTSIIIPDSVTSIGERAFSNCTGLTEIYYNAGEVTGFTSSSNIFYNAGTSGDGITVIFGDTVKSIPDYLFGQYSRPNITSVTIGINVTNIGNSAFRGCRSLTSVTIPDSVTSIGDSAFYNCRSLTSVTIPNSVTSIGEGAFEGCSGLTSITLPFVGAQKDGTENTHFGYIFGADSSDYQDVDVPASLKTVVITGGTSIADHAFGYCSGLTSIIIPDGVTSIGYETFEFCSSLTSITIPDSVTSIGSLAFNGCLKLVEVYNLSDLPLQVGSSNYGCVANYAKNVYTQEGGSWFTDTQEGYRFLYDGETGYLLGYYGTETVLTLPQSFTAYNGTRVDRYEIYKYAFAYCSSLTSITIPNSVTSIGGWAFNGCSSLTSITIPDSVTSIGREAFWGCVGLEKLYYNVAEITPLTPSSNVFYQAGGANGITVIFGDSVKSVPSYLFYVDNATYYPRITRVTIGNSVTSIGVHAFDSCKGLTSVTIGNSVTSIGVYAFRNCSRLTSITIPNSVTSIGSYAFQGCSGLTSVIIPDSVTSIGSYAFSGCSGLTSITIPDSVTSIGSYAFSGCSGLTSITIPDSVTSIGEYAFQNCSGLESITVENGNSQYHSYGNCLIETASKTLIAGCKNSIIPTDGSVTSIENYAFSGCSGLTNITIPDSVTSIGSSAFSGCSGLTSITIPDGVTSIGNSAFVNCSGLTSITIPDGVTSIGEFAFWNCSSLTSITIPDGVTSIGWYAFQNCDSLSKVYYGGTAEDWADISIGSYNSALTSATRYYYSKTQPTQAGNYWHYVDGKIVEW